MKTIWKYDLQIIDRQEIEMPKYALILSVQMQYDHMCLWAVVTPNAEKTTRVIYIAGTGHNVDHLDHTKHRFLGTVQMRGGALVWHIFEEEV